MKKLIRIIARTMSSVILMEGKNDNWYIVIDSLFKLLVFLVITILPLVIGLLYVFDIADDSHVVTNVSFLVPATLFVLLLVFYCVNRNEIIQERDLILANEDKIRTRKYANRIVYMALYIFFIEFVMVVSYFMATR